MAREVQRAAIFGILKSIYMKTISNIDQRKQLITRKIFTVVVLVVQHIQFKVTHLAII